MAKASEVLAQLVTEYVKSLPRESIDAALSQLPTFIHQTALDEWIAGDGPRFAYARAIMALAKAEIAEGSQISMMQYIWYKQALRKATPPEESMDFDEIENELVFASDTPEGQMFISQIWSMCFISRAHRRLVERSSGEN